MRLYLQTIFILFCLLFFTQSIDAQIGIRAKYLSNGIDNGQEKLFQEFNSDVPFGSAYAIGVDYWFRLKDKRIEFLPEVGFGYSQKSIGPEQAITKFAHTVIFFNLNTRIYPMDFGGDCDCPTFSNQSTLIKKGFYFELSPGLALNNSSSNNVWTDSSGDNIELNDTGFISYKIGIGAGLDIGISNLLTINPYAMYNYHFNVDHIAGNIPEEYIPGDTEYGTTQGQLELGVRFAIRFDAKNY